jgi:hypothetical protein
MSPRPPRRQDPDPQPGPDEPQTPPDPGAASPAPAGPTAPGGSIPHHVAPAGEPEQAAAAAAAQAAYSPARALSAAIRGVRPGPTGDPAPDLVDLLNLIAEEVGAVRKTQQNTSPGAGWNFRGVDQVTNAISPVMLKHGVRILPGKVLRYDHGQIEVGGNRTRMTHARVHVRYTICGPVGQRLKGEAVGEAMDSGDKATAKAMSVAWRTFLLETFMLPTDEPDPDSQSYHVSQAGDMSPQQRQAQELLAEIEALARRAAGPRGPDYAVQYIAHQWAEEHHQPIEEATDVGSLELLRDDLLERLRRKEAEARQARAGEGSQDAPQGPQQQHRDAAAQQGPVADTPQQQAPDEPKDIRTPQQQEQDVRERLGGNAVPPGDTRTPEGGNPRAGVHDATRRPPEGINPTPEAVQAELERLQQATQQGRDERAREQAAQQAQRDATDEAETR